MKQEAVLKATAVRSPLPVMWSIPHSGVAVGGFGWGRGVGEGGRGVWGRGQETFHPPCHIYCTTTWYFALKGLRTMSGCTHCGSRRRSPRARTHSTTWFRRPTASYRLSSARSRSCRTCIVRQSVRQFWLPPRPLGCFGSRVTNKTHVFVHTILLK